MNRKFYKIIFVISILIQFTHVFAQKLYVFYPTVVRPHILQKKLSEACPDFEITVFGRFADFKAKVELDKPHALLTKPDVLKQTAMK